MNIAVYNPAGKEGFLGAADAALLSVSVPFNREEINGAAAFFNLDENSIEEDYAGISVPIFIHSVIKPLNGLPDSSNMIRINAWPGFSAANKWEYAGEASAKHEEVAKALGKIMIKTSDEPGFISARIVAMIINEAFYALGENVSSEEEIDVAMKLGTNYPAGPFEWCRAIGAENVLNLLNKLAEKDSKYSPAPELKSLIEKS